MNLPASSRLRRFYLIAMVPIVLVMIGLLVTLSFHPQMPTFAGFCVVTLLFLGLLGQLHRGYKLTKEALEITSVYGVWRIPLKEIAEVSDPKYPLWKFLGQRVVIHTKRKKEVVTMPEDAEGFCRRLRDAL